MNKQNSANMYVCVCFLTSSRDIDSQAVTCFGSHKFVGSFKARLFKNRANTLFVRGQSCESYAWVVATDNIYVLW